MSRSTFERPWQVHPQTNILFLQLLQAKFVSFIIFLRSMLFCEVNPMVLRPWRRHFSIPNWSFLGAAAATSCGRRAPFLLSYLQVYNIHTSALSLISKNHIWWWRQFKGQTKGNNFRQNLKLEMGRRTTCLNILNFLHFARFQQGFGDGKRIWLTKCFVAKCSYVHDHVLQFLTWFLKIWKMIMCGMI